MPDRLATHYLQDAIRQFHSLKALADGALAQTDDDDLSITLDGDANSIAMLLKHVAGSMQTRWAGFPRTAEDAQDRDRDSEFMVADEDTKALLIERWEAGWRYLFKRARAPHPRGYDHDHSYPWKATLGARSDQSPAHTLRLPCRPDRLPGKAFPLRRLAVTQYPAGSVQRGSPPQQSRIVERRARI